MSSALDKQVGGDHYKVAIQPVEFMYLNRLGYLEGNAIKYLTRRRKNGRQDLEKAIHYCQLTIDLHHGGRRTESPVLEFAIPPSDYVEANGLEAIEGDAIHLICASADSPNGEKMLLTAIQCCEQILIQDYT